MKLFLPCIFLRKAIISRFFKNLSPPAVAGKLMCGEAVIKSGLEKAFFPLPPYCRSHGGRERGEERPPLRI